MVLFYFFSSHRIWNFLVETTRTSKLAVIITTHYIDEARQANSVSSFSNECGCNQKGDTKKNQSAHESLFYT